MNLPIEILDRKKISQTWQTENYRIFELLVTAALWGALGVLFAGSSDGYDLSLWVAMSALLAGTVCSSLVWVPLAARARSTVRTATARRLTEASVLSTLAFVAISWAGGVSIPSTGLVVVGALVWATLAALAEFRPLPISSSDNRWSGLSQVDCSTHLARVSKRTVDVVGAAVLIAILSPVLLVTAFVIRRSDGGPIFFTQERIGGGVAAVRKPTFCMIKFRSMVIDAEARKLELAESNERGGPLFKVSGDPRITKVGKVIRELSIDELPQLFNVLIGSMSLVGPRPALVDEWIEFDEEFRQSRLKTKPGLTGLWQAEARTDPDFSRYRSLDIKYVNDWSLGLDLRILLATASMVLAAVLTRPLHRFSHSVAHDSIVPVSGDDAAVVEFIDRLDVPTTSIGSSGLAG